MDRDQPSPQRNLTVLVATGNRHKLEEIRDILADSGIDLVSLSDVSLDGLPAPVEDGATFEANAILKARYYASASGMPSLADDSGLVVDALDGAPGVQSARWMGDRTPYAVKNARLLELLTDVPEPARTARFICVVALAWPDGRIETARGVHEGRIHDAVSGVGGFGYDPIFYSLEACQTFGTLSEAQKNAMSHRGRALRALKPRLHA